MSARASSLLLTSRLGQLTLAAAFFAGATSVAHAQVAGGRVLFAVQPASGKIIQINPATGAVGPSFTAPGVLNTTDTLIGLSGAEGGNVLIYRDATAANTSSNVLYRINPVTGATLSSNTSDGFTDDGLTYENPTGSADRIIYSHSSSDTHIQAGYGGSTTFFYTTGTPIGGLGGDGLGRDFGYFTDGLIHEFNGSIGTSGVALSTGYAAPATDIQGLAFDGVNLFASTASGRLYTLNANTGAVLGNVAVTGGALYGLGTAVPEPTSALAALGAVFGLTRRARRGRD